MDIQNKRFRCHGSIVLEKTGKTIFFLLILVAANMADALTAMDVSDFNEELIGILVIVGGILIVLGIIVILAVINWRKTTITIDDEAIVWERDTLNKKTLTIGIKSISSINIERNIFERILGTAKLKLDTDSLSTADATDVEFIFKHEDALAYKAYLEAKVRENKDGATVYGAEHIIENPTGKTIGKADIEPEGSHSFDKNDRDYANMSQGVADTSDNIHYTKATYTSDFEEIVMHCIFDLRITSLLVGIPIIVFAILGTVSMYMDGELGFEAIIASIIQIGAFGYAALYSIIGKFFRYYNLTVSRQENRIHMKYGMLKIREYILPVEKINAIHLKQTLIGRLFKRYNVSVECVGVGDNENEIAQLTLSLKLDEIRERLSVLLPEYDLSQLEQVRPVGKRAMWHKLMRLVVIAFFVICVNVGIVIGAQMVDDFGAESLDATFWIIDGIVVGAILLYTLLYSLLQVKVEAVGVCNKHLISVTGSYGKDITMMSYKKIQYVSVRKSPISRISGLVRGSVNILAGVLDSTKIVPYMDEYQVDSLTERVCDRMTLE